MDAGHDAGSQGWRDNLPPWADDITERARQFDPDTLSTGQVIGVAAGAAVALGTLIVALGPAEEDQPRATGRPATAVTKGAKGAPLVAVVQGRKVSDRTRGQLRQQVEALQGELEQIEGVVKRQREERGIIAAGDVLIPVSGKERDNVADDSVVAVLKNGKLTRRSRKELHKQVNAVQKDIDRLNKAVRKQGRGMERQASIAEAREAAGNFGDTVGKRIAAAGAATTAATAPLIERARGIEIPDSVRDNARQVADSTREGARQFAGATRDRTADLTDRVRGDFVPFLADRAGKAQDRVQEVVPQLASRVREDFLPQVAEQFQHVRDDLVPQVAEQLGRVRDEVVPQVAERLQQVRDDLAPQVTDAATRVGTQVSALAATGAAASRGAAKDFSKSDLGKQLEKKTRGGRKQATSTLNDLTAQLMPQKQKSNLNGLWIFAIVAAIGGALYYYVFKDEERRKKVIETTKSVVEQGREIVRDFQGYDEEF